MQYMHFFGDIAGFCAPDPTPVGYSTLFWGYSHWTRSPMLGSSRAETLSYSAVKLFLKYSNLCDHGIWTSWMDRQANRQTDRKTRYYHNSLCVSSHGK